MVVQREGGKLVIHEKTAITLSVVFIIISVIVASVVYGKSLESKINLVEERENNHYSQLKDDLDRIETKIDGLSQSIYNSNTKSGGG